MIDWRDGFRALLILVFIGLALGQAAAQDAASGPTEPLSIVGRDGRHIFAVEVMRNDADRARGLMYRRAMAPDHGMLFDFQASAPVAMSNA